MESTRYRSFVIRVWGPAIEGSDVARVVVEEVQSGNQVELRGEQARVVVRNVIDALEGSTARATPGPGPLVAGSRGCRSGERMQEETKP